MTLFRKHKGDNAKAPFSFYLIELSFLHTNMNYVTMGCMPFHVKKGLTDL